MIFIGSILVLLISSDIGFISDIYFISDIDGING